MRLVVSRMVAPGRRSDQRLRKFASPATGDAKWRCTCQQVALRPRPHGGKFPKHGLLPPPVQITADHVELAAIHRAEVPDGHQLMAIGIGQTAKQQRVHNAEDGCRRAHTDRNNAAATTASGRFPKPRTPAGRPQEIVELRSPHGSLVTGALPARGSIGFNRRGGHITVLLPLNILVCCKLKSNKDI